MKWSFLTTNYNKADTVRRSVESMLDNLPDNGEIVVVDGESTDGSTDILREMEAEYEPLEVHITPCNLGEGRQIAVDRSKGEVLVQHLDTDRLYDDFSEYLEIYQELSEKVESLFFMTLDSIYISHRDVVEDMGGWPPLGRIEERVFVDRAIEYATPRLYPCTHSRELPTKDISDLRSRMKKWKKNARDQLRTGFSLGQIFRFHHHQFPFPKALVADAIAVVAALEARGMERYGRERESWTEIPSWEYGIDKDSEIVLDGPEEFGVLE